ncbi:MAG TPA: 1-acyl-sn-glycerol-3-phosphate acyltransferase [Saprospiraceae bacterium]|nr:1-acyl-sn-glycerol-3-phosphate acyltransferase [Saprospiraceae bacterium]HMQ83054.1 1-acyl-sn-glycerol-3-phosphate acyltransferase [Saprospiraceae bacterium]
MLYPIVRPIAALGERAFFRKIYLSNTDRIPKDAAVILAANHPTAFLEPCILACYLDRPLYFLVRGDFFKVKLFSALLKDLHMLPIYRMKDGGYEKVKENHTTLDACYRALSEHKTIMILAEGRCIHEKRLRPLQKGAARIALGTLEQYPHVGEVYVVPVGVNFTYADQPRSEVMIDFGHPLLASEYLSKYKENANLCLQQFTDDLRNKLEERIVIIDNPADDTLAEQLLQMHRTDYADPLFPAISDSSGPLQREILVTRQLNELADATKETLKNKSDQYFQMLHQYGITDRVFAGTRENTWLNTLALILGFIPFLIGYIWNYPPQWIGDYIARTRIKSVEFKMPVKWAVQTGAYLFYVIGWIVMALVYKAWWLLAAIPLLLVLGYYAIYFVEFMQAVFLSGKAAQIPKAIREELHLQRQEILSLFESGV